MQFYLESTTIQIPSSNLDNCRYRLGKGVTQKLLLLKFLAIQGGKMHLWALSSLPCLPHYITNWQEWCWTVIFIYWCLQSTNNDLKQILNNNNTSLTEHVHIWRKSRCLLKKRKRSSTPVHACHHCSWSWALSVSSHFQLSCSSTWPQTSLGVRLNYRSGRTTSLGVKLKEKKTHKTRWTPPL